MAMPGGDVQGVLGVEGEVIEALEGTDGGVRTPLPRASLAARSSPAVTVPIGRCTGQAAELLCGDVAAGSPSRGR